MERWRDIIGYEGMYSVSDFGRVKSLSRLTKHKYTDFMSKEIFLKSAVVKSYEKVLLRKDGKNKMFMVHRLVAFAFLPNKENLPFIDHINNIPTDNRLVNLQWITHQDNIKKRELNKLKK